MVEWKIERRNIPGEAGTGKNISSAGSIMKWKKDLYQYGFVI